MNNLEKLQAWGANAQRKYDDGVKIFEAIARDHQKKEFSAYFAQVSGNVATFDPHFTQLVNCLVRIERQCITEPHLYPAALETAEEDENIDESEMEQTISRLVEEKQAAIQSHQEAVENIKTELIARIEDNRDDAEISDSELQSQLDEHTAAIEELQAEVEELSKPGVKIVTEGQMPKGMRKKYQRIKEIVPLYSQLHHELSDADLSDEERKEIANELCNLDDERRKLWAEIDAWAEGKGQLKVDAERPKYSENAVVRGYELARAVKRLKQNIVNSQKSAEKAQQDGRLVVYNNAVARIAAYQAELAEIEKEISATEDEQPAE